MIKAISLLMILTSFSIDANTTLPSSPNDSSLLKSSNDSIRMAELDQYWNALALTVKEGDFAAYAALYHEDAVIVFSGGEDKKSVPIATALARWEKGFKATKAGEQQDQVEFRFSQRIGDETTAHETGIFCFISLDEKGKLKGEYLIHFEALLVKKDQGWLAIMEHQKTEASREEWEALKRYDK